MLDPLGVGLRRFRGHADGAQQLDHAATKPALSRVRFRQADAVELPFEDESFDALVCQFGAQGTPMRAELEAADPTGLEAATAAAAEAIAERFGEGAFETELCALVVETAK